MTMTTNNKIQWKLWAALPLLALLLMANTKVSAQVAERRASDDTVYDVVDRMPEYPGGWNGLAEYLSGNIHYPEEAAEHNIEGRVMVGFVIEKDGSVTDVEVLRGIGYGCDQEAIRVVSGMARWQPGIKDDQPVRVHFNLPISFRLQPKENNQ